MLYGGKRTIEDKIIEYLVVSPAEVKSIHHRLQQQNAKISLRAVYKAVQKLIDAAVILKTGKRLHIDEEWLRRVQEQLHTKPSINIEPGDRMAYTFTSLTHLDAFWKTIVLPLQESTSGHEIFFYNPHNFWAYLPDRKESEDSYYRRFSDKKLRGFFTIGGLKSADKEFKRYYQTDNLQIDLRDIDTFSRTDHITILGPLILTVRLSKALTASIDSLYSTGNDITDILPSIVRECSNSGTTRFIIENNDPKAAKLRKVLAKNFYFKGLTSV